jgi:hypothetical protein
MPQLASNSIPINKQGTNPDIYYEETETDHEPYPETTNTNTGLSLEEKIQIAIDILCWIGRVIRVIFIATLHILPALLTVVAALLFIALISMAPIAAIAVAAIVVFASDNN